MLTEASLYSLSSSLKQISTLSSTHIKMKGQTNILKSEIELDGGRGLDVTRKKEEVSKLNSKIEKTSGMMGSVYNELGEKIEKINKKAKEEAKEKVEKINEEEEENTQEKIEEDNGEIKENVNKNADEIENLNKEEQTAKSLKTTEKIVIYA
ncbi:hypothetical protein [Orenia marismortui]|uniref:hypothetical protein n=1 Tax=Orenia marismortui TaxID=46469 RepID=UPI000382BBE1|nr:hypothetical protein [Orenia marismortui]